MSTDTAPRTIARTATRQLAAIKASHTECRVYSLRSNFTAQRIPADMAWAYLDKFGGRYSISVDAANVVTIHLTSNDWYTLRTPAAAAADPRDAHALAVRAELTARYRGAVEITDDAVAAVLAAQAS